MHTTTRDNRLHIALFGRRNAGKSSVINAITKQIAAIVSEVAGTTTDPVYKAMEVLPLGPVVLIDTAGLDDEGELGELRIRKTMEVLAKTDMALVIVDNSVGIGDLELELIRNLREKKIATVAVFNKTDLKAEISPLKGVATMGISTNDKRSIEKLKLVLLENAPQHWDEVSVVGDLLEPNDVVILVTPIDSAAPKGRLILPQVQLLRDVLDNDAMGYVVKETQLLSCLNSLGKLPKLVITDSQVFAQVDRETPEGVLFTSFSILFARYKGDLEQMVRGAKAIKELKPGDKVLIAEACTHHRVEDDIGTVKLPKWLQDYVGGELDISWCSGATFPTYLEQYKLIIHCGSCMINRREMLSRLFAAEAKNVPMTNYGVAIAFLQGVLARALSPFPEIRKIL